MLVISSALNTSLWSDHCLGDVSMRLSCWAWFRSSLLDWASWCQVMKYWITWVLMIPDILPRPGLWNNAMLIQRFPIKEDLIFHFFISQFIPVIILTRYSALSLLKIAIQSFTGSSHQDRKMLPFNYIKTWYRVWRIRAYGVTLRQPEKSSVQKSTNY